MTGTLNKQRIKDLQYVAWVLKHHGITLKLHYLKEFFIAEQLRSQMLN